MYGDGLQSVTADLTVVQPRFSASIGTTLQQARERELPAGDRHGRHHPLRHRALPDQLGRAVRDSSWRIATASTSSSSAGACPSQYVSRYQSDDEFRFTVNLLGIGGIGSGVGSLAVR